MNSRDKGARGEVELAHKLNEYGFHCWRGQQFSGANGDADVVGLPLIHIECKRVEHLNLYKAMEQALRDSQVKQLIPTVFHRKNRKSWLVTMYLEDWISLYKAYLNKEDIYYE